MRSMSLVVTIALIVLQSPLVLAKERHAGPSRLSPTQAVMNAAEMPTGIGGVFEMVVRATGRQGRYLYLNSEADYRDPRNLTITIGPVEESALADRLGGPVEAMIMRKVIAVRGIAKKTRIDFMADGRPTGKYYFQTHLNLRSSRDLTVEGERAIP